MKAAMARVTHKHFFVIFLGLLSAFSLASSAWPYSVAQNQNCSGNCESHERLAAFTHSKPLDVDAVSFTLAEETNVIQAADLSGGISAQALKSPGTEGASTPGTPFFLLIGLALIGVRLIISYRSRKVKNLATETH